MPKYQPVTSVRRFSGSRRSSKRSIKGLLSGTIVCDVGSAMTRIGFAKYNSPQIEIPSFIAHHNLDPRPVKDGFGGNPNFFVGEQAIKQRRNYKFIQPIKRGEIEDVDSTVLIMDYGFNRINALSNNVEDLSGRNLLVALRPSATKSKKEELFRTLMETYGMDGCYFAFQQPLVLYATGRLTGLVVDSGEEISHVVPVYEGNALNNAIETVNMGGFDVTDRLAHYLTPLGFRFHMQSLADRELVNDMKIKLAFVSRSRVGGRMASAKPYILPDGIRIVLQNERYLCTEPLFNPADIGRRDQGMATAVANALRKCDRYIQRELIKNIVPCGGNSLLKGFNERLRLEVNGIAPGGSLPVVRSFFAANKLNACWTGGAVLARSPTFVHMLVTQAEYNEEGSRVFRRKCF